MYTIVCISCTCGQLLIVTIITGAASDLGWNRTQSVPPADGRSVVIFAKRLTEGHRVRERRREGGVKLEGGTGCFISTELR